MSASRLERGVRGLAGVILRRPRRVIAGAVAALLGTGAVAMGLPLDGSFASLLPKDDPDVAAFHRVMADAGGSGDMIVAVSGPPERRLAFARRLVRRLRAEPFVRAAEVELPLEFFLDRRLLMLPTTELKQLRDAVHGAVTRARARANPLFVDLEDDDGAVDAGWKALDDSEARARADLPPRSRVTQDGRWLLVRVRPLGGFSDLDAGADTLRRIQADVADLARHERAVEIRYAGALPMNQEQQAWMTADLRVAALVALALVVLIVTLGLRRLAAPLVLGLPLLLGVASTLAVARLGFGRLNLVSGFLVSTLFGLGIDFGLHLYLRYVEHLRALVPPRRAMADAVVGTLRGSSTAAWTTIAAFLAVASSSFRGFREFGLIAAVGILLTLLATYLVLPPLALLLVKRPRPRAQRRRRGGAHDVPRWLAWSVVAVGAALTAVSLDVGAIRWQGDFDALRGSSALVEFSHRVEVEQGGVLAPALLRVPSLDDARRLATLINRRAEHPGSEVRRVLALTSMLPPDPEGAAPLLADLRRDLDSVDLDRLDRDDRAHVETARRLAAARPWTLDDVPEAFTNTLAPRSGRGALVAVWPRSYMATDRDVTAWAEELRQVGRLAAARGIAVDVLDENVLAAKVLTLAKAEVPRVVALAALAVLFILVLDFRRAVPVAMVLGSLGLGLVWTVGVMGLFGIEINVFNQAVLPTLVGMGLDNAIHLEHRYAALGPGSLGRLLRTTGFAALLAALTTASGFGATLGARHAGVRSMGQLAVAGFACTFLAGTVLLPMVRRLLEGRQRRPVAVALDGHLRHPCLPDPQ